MEFKGKKILITGGSSGIGKALISQLYLHGARQFAVVGRSAEKMQALAIEFHEASFSFLAGDLAQPGTASEIISRLRQEWDSLDILINNAGVVSAGPLENISDEDIIAMQNVNVTGVILLTKHALPLLKQSNEAAIINVSSGLGLIGMAFYAAYAATKAAVRQFSEALRRELNCEAIHVMTLYPTATDTPMMKTAKASAMDSPEIVAAKTIEGLINRQTEVIMGGEKMLENRRLNFETPLELDEKLKANYDAMRQRARGHRSM
jgi:short-subunit dehydrogenase